MSEGRKGARRERDGTDGATPAARAESGGADAGDRRLRRQVVERQPARLAASIAPANGWARRRAAGRCRCASLRRRGLRRRMSAALIVAALGPVIAVSVVAVALIFSSVEQGIEFEAVRGLQVARGLFLQQVQQLAAGAAALGDDAVLLRAQAPRRHGARLRLGELSMAMPNAIYETTDATGRIVARCSKGICDELAGRGGAASWSRPTARRSSCARSPTSARSASSGRANGWWCAPRCRWSIRRCGCSAPRW